MTACVACYILVDENCPHCHELYEKARDFVELLKARGCVSWNLSRWGFPADYWQVVDNAGGQWAVRTPTLLVVLHGEGGDRVLYKRVLSLDDVSKNRRFILDDVALAFHRAARDEVKKCYERRGRKAGGGEKKAKKKKAAAGG